VAAARQPAHSVQRDLTLHGGNAAVQAVVELVDVRKVAAGGEAAVAELRLFLLQLAQPLVGGASHHICNVQPAAARALTRAARQSANHVPVGVEDNAHRDLRFLAAAFLYLHYITPHRSVYLLPNTSRWRCGGSSGP